MRKILVIVAIFIFCLMSPAQALENNYIALWDDAGVGLSGAIVFVVPAGDADTSQSNPDRVNATDLGTGGYSFADVTAGVYDMWTYRPGDGGVKEATSLRLGHYYPIDGTVTTPKIASWAVTGAKLADPIDTMNVLQADIDTVYSDTTYSRAIKVDSLSAISVLDVPLIAGDPLYVKAGNVWINTALARLSYAVMVGDVLTTRRVSHDPP